MKASLRVLLGSALLGLAACGDGSSSGPDAAPTCTPVNDNNECTEDVCEAGSPVNNPRTGEACTGGGTCNAQGMCVVVAPACDDGVQNGSETDVDCGGSCAPANGCAVGDSCAVGTDCDLEVCIDDVCTTPACGDGVMTGTEGCDDGNQTNGDGCDDGVDGTCRPTGCGNGVVTGTEVCDDGNDIQDDGCDNNCTVTACGNGVATGTEVCDDGNQMNGDGCDDAADGNCTESACGNGVTAGAEMCDDGNVVDGDGCQADCTILPCGNGVLDAGEVCDDGNRTDGDGCDDGASGLCVATTCGNGVLDATETCDDGWRGIDGATGIGGDGCDAACAIEVGAFCDTAVAPSECGWIVAAVSDPVAIADGPGGCTAGPGAATAITVESVNDCTMRRVYAVGAAVVHTWPGDLNFVLTTPTGTAMTVLSRVGTTTCGNADNWNAAFFVSDRDPALPTLTAGVPAAGTTYLATMNGAGVNTDVPAVLAGADEQVAGTWTLSVTDNASGDIGTVGSLDVRASCRAN